MMQVFPKAGTGRIPVDRIKEGMVVADDVRDINSRLLIPAGEKIKNKHIRILKIWGVPEVKIQGAQSDENHGELLVDGNEFIRKKENVKEVFHRLDSDHPALKELFRIAVAYRGVSGRTKKEETAPLENQIPLDVKNAACFTIDTSEIRLPETPAIIEELNAIIAAPYSGADDIARVVNKSPSLTAFLLKIVNSAFYNFPEKIDSIPWAVTLIGTKEIVNLALGITVMEVFKDIPEKTVDMRSFLIHAFSCGIISRILGAHKNTGRTEQLFISGLLHDIGRLVIYKYFPDQANELVKLSMALKKPLYMVEKEYGGIDHTAIAARLLQKWRLPLGLVGNIRYYYSPSKAQDHLHPAIVHISDVIATGSGLGSSGEAFIPGFDHAAWKKLDLSPKLFESTLRQTLHQLNYLSRFFKGNLMYGS